MAKKKDDLQEQSLKKDRRNLALFLLVVFVITMFTLFGDNGFVDVYRLNKDKKTIEESNKLLAEENKKIKNEITRLESDDRYIAEIAKKDLGMVGTEEVIYIIEDKNTNDTK